MSKKTLKPLTLAISATFVGSLAMSNIAAAGENPFGMTKISDTTSITVAKDGKCGEGKCGKGKKADAKKKDGKCGEGKCGEGKCGTKKKTDAKKKDGKCGEGKCGKK